MRPASLIPQLSRGFHPFGPVPCPRTGDGVGDLVEEHLVDVVIFGQDTEVPGHGDTSFVVVAGAETGFSVVEREAPGGVKVKGDESFRPDFHSR